MRNSIFYIIICATLVFSSCDKNVHDKEQGVSVELQMPTDDKAEDITIRAFDNEGVLVSSYNFESIAEVSSTLLPLAVGDYTLVSTAGTSSSFTVTEQIGTTTLNDLLLTMKDLSTSPNHAHYGVATAKSENKTYNQTVIKKNRIFAELGLTINNIPNEIIKAEATILNTAKGFYPATQKLTAEYASVSLGEIAVVNNSAKFPLYRLMPTVEMTTRSETDIKTRIEFVFHYENGNKLIINVTIPQMTNGGSYTVDIDFAIFRTDITVDITDIIGWDDDEDSNGEILNPI